MLAIIVNGKRLDPKEAAAQARPLDTALICPHCLGGNVGVQTTQLPHRFKLDGHLEHGALVPRVQDRYCLDCGNQWATILPPTSFTDGMPR
jgi:hypothetical protein